MNPWGSRVFLLSPPQCGPSFKKMIIVFYFNKLNLLFSLLLLFLLALFHCPYFHFSPLSSMLSPLYSDSSVIIQRAPPLRPAHVAQPRVHYHPRPGGGSRCRSPTYYHAVYNVRVEKCRDAPFSFGHATRKSPEEGVVGGTLHSLVAGDSWAPPVGRRGALVDHRDVIKAHQSHKMQSTPRARRKDWE